MFTFSLAEAFLTVFIGMGPVKVLLIYIAKTKGLEQSVRQAMARRIVLVAGSVAVALFILGALLQQILHFSIGALNIIGGLILLLLALNMVLGGGKKVAAGQDEVDPMSMAVSPLAIPLTLNPVGIVSLVVASSEVTDLPSSIAIVVMIAIVMLINLGVLLLSDRVAKYLSAAIVELLEVVLGILLGALAIQLMLNGLAEVGVITLSGHG
ncbi:MAG: MarC family protein [Chloroflexota bacterium]|jgi:multiple antibiotic resistance protein